MSRVKGRNALGGHSVAVRSDHERQRARINQRRDRAERTALDKLTRRREKRAKRRHG
jgi:hypothetical protein